MQLSTSKNDNTKIDLRVEHLAQPDKLTPRSYYYVVWAKANKDAAPQNIGALSVDHGLAGRLQTEIPLHSCELFLTAEASGESRQPTGERLLWTRY